MSAVDEYEKAKYTTALPPDRMVRDAVMSILVKADAAIAELEAENERLKAEQGLHIEYVSVNEYGEELVACQAELAALKEQLNRSEFGPSSDDD